MSNVLGPGNTAKKKREALVSNAETGAEVTCGVMAESGEPCKEENWRGWESCVSKG